jgi:hypothetical protein
MKLTRNGLYILDAHGKPVPEPDVLKWGAWFEVSGEQRIVKQEMVGSSKVSTVFLGIDHGWRSKAPILWETMVFGGELDQAMDRCSGTRKNALAMHRKMLRKVKGQV